jgi:hypothetical protein
MRFIIITKQFRVTITTNYRMLTHFIRVSYVAVHSSLYRVYSASIDNNFMWI